MVAKTMQYINWFDSAHWSSRVIIGNEEKYYNFKADWNSRDEYWAITISTLDDIPIIQGKKMVLGVDLLTYCHIHISRSMVFCGPVQIIKISKKLITIIWSTVR